MDVNSKLSAFLREAAGRKFQLGTFDCGLWLADWYVFATGGPDPAAQWRGTYRDEAGWRALGFPLVIARAFDRAGVPRTNDPLPGDIGILRNKPGKGSIGAIKTKVGWVFLAIGGGVQSIRPEEMPNVRVMAAWRT